MTDHFVFEAEIIKQCFCLLVSSKLVVVDINNAIGCKLRISFVWMQTMKKTISLWRKHQARLVAITCQLLRQPQERDLCGNPADPRHCAPGLRLNFRAARPR